MGLVHAITEVLTTMGTAAPDLVGAMLSILRPTAKDLDAIFVRGSVRRDPEPLPAVTVPGVARTVVRFADAGSLVRPPSGFDRRYATIAQFLAPGPLWAAFVYLDAEGRPLASFDGLVLRRDRWCWCPRPWSFLGAPVATALNHWTF